MAVHEYETNSNVALLSQHRFLSIRLIEPDSARLLHDVPQEPALRQAVCSPRHYPSNSFSAPT
jgi:hypothetical protein